ncbi:MAG: DUF4339 domain-containing protein [Chitinophagaceae bacterium]
MKKYFLNDGTGQQGPFSIEELKEKGIAASTPIWYDGLEKWTTAGELPELDSILVHTPPPFEAVKPPVTETPVVTITEKPAAASVAAAPVASATPAATGKKSTAWVSWAFLVAVLGGVGYFVYQDMEKNKGANSTTTVSISTADTATANTAPEATTTTTEPTATADTATTPSMATDPVVTEPATTTTTPATDPTATKPAVTDKEKAAAKAKADAEAKKKADELKKKQLAALAAKEASIRNQWPKYVAVGNINYITKDDGLDDFEIPILNGTGYAIDRVTLKVDYFKKEGKIVKTETLVVDNLPSKGGKSAKAPGNKKARKVNVYITGITSRSLHFCYPMNNGNAADPYYCK